MGTARVVMQTRRGSRVGADARLDSLSWAKKSFRAGPESSDGSPGSPGEVAHTRDRADGTRVQSECWRENALVSGCHTSAGV